MIHQLMIGQYLTALQGEGLADFCPVKAQYCLPTNYADIYINIGNEGYTYQLDGIGEADLSNPEALLNVRQLRALIEKYPFGDREDEDE
ncbi:MAG TPA: hypothetical protein V6D27_00990 [Vampirovibrionales bacterium]